MYSNEQILEAALRLIEETRKTAATAHFHAAGATRTMEQAIEYSRNAQVSAAKAAADAEAASLTIKSMIRDRVFTKDREAAEAAREEAHD